MMILRAFKWDSAAAWCTASSMWTGAVRRIDAVLHGAYQEFVGRSFDLGMRRYSDSVMCSATIMLAIS